MTSAVLVVAGTEATAIVLALSVLRMTGSTYWVSAVLAASLGLAMLLGPFGGVVADRYDRRRVLTGVALAETVIFATAALAATRPWELLAAAALAAVVAVPYGPAQAAAVQALISDERLPGANAALFGSNQVAVLVAPAAAGIVFAAGRRAGGDGRASRSPTRRPRRRSRACTARRGPSPSPGAGSCARRRPGFGELVRARMVLVTTIAVAVMIAVDGAVVVAMIPLAGEFGTRRQRLRHRDERLRPRHAGRLVAGRAADGAARPAARLRLGCGGVRRRHRLRRDRAGVPARPLRPRRLGRRQRPLRHGRDADLPAPRCRTR